jgi:cation diffusion facilitator family transporter
MPETSRLSTTRRVSIVSALTNALLSVAKILIGWIGNSHALIADGVHSFTDVISDGLVYLAAKMGGREPDADHPYGHRRIETIGVIIIAIMLMLVGAGIIYDSIKHFLDHQTSIPSTTPVMITALLSVALNEWLFRYTLKAGKAIQSDLLISNAWHNRSDALVSMIVLLSIVGAFFGVHYLDAIGAGIIAILILKAGFKMLYQSINELIDTAVDPETLEQIRATIFNVQGVVDIHMLRTRLHASEIFIDVHILVAPKISVSEGHYISDQVQKALLTSIENSTDVTVHIDPEDDEKVMPSVRSPSRNELEQQLRACWEKLPAYIDIQRITIHYLDSDVHIEVYFPMHVLKQHDADTLKQNYLNNCASLKDIHQIELYFGA